MTRWILLAVALLVAGATLGCGDSFKDPLAGVHEPETQDEQALASTAATYFRLADAADPDACDYASADLRRLLASASEAQLKPATVKKLEAVAGRPFDCRMAYELSERRPEETTVPDFDKFLVVGDVDGDEGEVLGIVGVGEPEPKWFRLFLQRSSRSSTGWGLDDLQLDEDHNVNTPGYSCLSEVPC